MREKKIVLNPDEKIQSMIRGFIIWLLLSWFTENNKTMFKHNIYNKRTINVYNHFNHEIRMHGTY